MPLKELRDQIDILDNKIIKLLEQRLKLAAETKKYKTKPTDRKREKEILEKTNNLYIRDIYKTIFKNSKKAV